MAENSTEGTPVSRTISETAGKQASPGGLYERIHGRKPGAEPTVARVVESEWVKRAKAGKLPGKVLFEPTTPATRVRTPKKVWGED